MSNNISFEEAVSTLKVMFPDWDEETLTTILISNNYHVERTIESVLTMSGDTNVNSSEPTPAPAPAPNAANNTDLLGLNQPQERALSGDGKDAPIPQWASSEYGAAESRYRGRMCNLPDDFLRPPGYSPKIIADEELALMLQNAMFRKEAQRLLGEDFVRGAQQNTAGRNDPQRRQSRPGAGANTAQNSGDLGIAKAFSSLGSAAKKNLSQLAERFSQSNKASRRDPGAPREFKALVGEEDEFEIISFDNKNRNKHRLNNDGTAEEDDEFAYQNPLFNKARSDTNDVN